MIRPISAKSSVLLICDVQERFRQSYRFNSDPADVRRHRYIRLRLDDQYHRQDGESREGGYPLVE